MTFKPIVDNCDAEPGAQAARRDRPPDAMTAGAASASVSSGAGRRAELIAAARPLLDTEGAEAITIRRVAAAVGIRGPSVYEHTDWSTTDPSTGRGCPSVWRTAPRHHSSPPATAT